jgi:hypothetical protein
MELKISKEILALADRCSREYRCLKGELCGPECQVAGSRRVVCHDPDPCAYKFPFGSNFFCTCPVRREIHNTYGK